jgi:hypothetical protein
MAATEKPTRKDVLFIAFTHTIEDLHCSQKARRRVGMRSNSMHFRMVNKKSVIFDAFGFKGG